MRTVLIQGASTAAGWHDFEKGGWVNRLSTVSLSFNATHTTEAINFQNDAIPGNTISPILRDMSRVDRFKRLGSVVTILSVGLNELKVLSGQYRPQITPERFNAALGEYAEYLDSRGVPTIYMGIELLRDEVIVTENHNAFERDLAQEYNQIISDHAKNTNMQYIDLQSILDDSMVNSDGYHPNGSGHKAIELATHNALRNLGLYNLDVAPSGEIPHKA